MTTPDAGDLLAQVLSAATPPPFALLHRPTSGAPGAVELVTGRLSAPPLLRDLPLHQGAGPSDDPDAAEHLVLVPFRQVTERGFAALDDHEPLLCLTVDDHICMPVADVVRRLPVGAGRLAGGFDVSDDDYAELVRTVVRDEIGSGGGANFVLHRSWEGEVEGHPLDAALGAFRSLLSRESGAYWTFLIHTGDRTFVGASPERHVTLHDGVSSMNPISGTYRYPASGPTLDGVLDFLSDTKETDELNMVLDEEVKMMSRLCRDVRVRGPYLREMARLAHTEYLVEGLATADVPTLLRDTMFAPTVTGSPIENACRVIAAHETRGRGYYSGFAALVGRDRSGAPWLDSAILIRTADVRAGGQVRIGVGATLVRHSDPVAEVAETAAKASGILAAFGAGEQRFAEHPAVTAALERRGGSISEYWRPRVAAGPAPVGPAGSAPGPASGVDGPSRRVLVVDAEDTFTEMIARQLTSAGWDASIVGCRDTGPGPLVLDGVDLVVLGPGPGDPRSCDDVRVLRLRAIAAQLLEQGTPFVAVCLGHQVLSQLLGLEVVPHPAPRQGLQREIELFGAREVVGFYNSYVAHCAASHVDVPGVGGVDVARDEGTQEVHALRGPSFASVQFHPESVLSLGGDRLLRGAVAWARRAVDVAPGVEVPGGVAAPLAAPAAARTHGPRHPGRPVVPVRA